MCVISFVHSQISYGATDTVLSDRFNFPYFFRTTGSDDTYYLVISKIAKYFQWNWVGIILFDDEKGERDLQLLKYYLSSENICIDFTLKITRVLPESKIVWGTLQKSSTNIIIFCGTVNIETVSLFLDLKKIVSEKTFIFTTNWLHYNHAVTLFDEFFYGSLLLMQNKAEYPSNSTYVPFANQFNPSRFPDDKLLENIWMYYYFCLSKNPQKNRHFKRVFKESLHNCSGQEKRIQCIVKTEQFLSYTNEVTSLLYLSSSLLFCTISVIIIGIFITNWDTPIVRANNRSLSILLLVSIKLSFLSVFLFLGRPVDITCMLRIITFGITFSIAVSSLLAKTIMICVAFKATKPGSSWRKWVGVKLSNSVVLFCSSIQIIICMTWLTISPPFQELDLHTYPGTIIIQCNEGSAIGFYSVIGYMGLLAAVSFVLAFLARTLPDSFNEAKYITFRMLLFCSVWITSAGLLGCIFLPKCYIILFKPEINIKPHLLGNNAS
ncbi:hypothetical protein XELAEV_18004463mg [Xenopus laevis]|uniref:G-protein coupled receptors family 3 profile domain-containing protein n=1 Tax=Xenopus laevis TaxID=8355 RepID=A0A974BRB8_XENLA|nr:hypothetical protein XELAEV_18004463mg [Xenopus laevis]